MLIRRQTVFQYKVDNYYNKESESGIIWNDENIGVNWMIDEKDILLANKDLSLPKFGVK